MIVAKSPTPLLVTVAGDRPDSSLTGCPPRWRPITTESCRPEKGLRTPPCDSDNATAERLCCFVCGTTEKSFYRQNCSSTDNCRKTSDSSSTVENEAVKECFIDARSTCTKTTNTLLRDRLLLICSDCRVHRCDIICPRCADLINFIDRYELEVSATKRKILELITGIDSPSSDEFDQAAASIVSGNNRNCSRNQPIPGENQLITGENNLSTDSVSSKVDKPGIKRCPRSEHSGNIARQSDSSGSAAGDTWCRDPDSIEAASLSRLIDIARRGNSSLVSSDSTKDSQSAKYVTLSRSSTEHVGSSSTDDLLTFKDRISNKINASDGLSLFETIYSNPSESRVVSDSGCSYVDVDETLVRGEDYDDPNHKGSFDCHRNVARSKQECSISREARPDRHSERTSESHDYPQSQEEHITQSFPLPQDSRINQDCPGDSIEGDSFPSSVFFSDDVREVSEFDAGSGKAALTEIYSPLTEQSRDNLPRVSVQVPCGLSTDLANELGDNKASLQGYSCDICSRFFSTEHGLSVHQRIHRSSDGKHCEICCKQFANSTSLSRHVLRLHRPPDTSASQLPHQCAECGKRFASADQRNTHAKFHTSRRPLACKLCDRTFVQMGDLSKHIRTHSGERPYVCAVCQRRFARPDSLKAHAVVHSGEKPFQCDSCTLSFAHRGNLSRHRRIHTGELPYKCHNCHLQFRRCERLNAHIARVHCAAPQV